MCCWSKSGGEPAARSWIHWRIVSSSARRTRRTLGGSCVGIRSSRPFARFLLVGARDAGAHRRVVGAQVEVVGALRNHKGPDAARDVSEDAPARPRVLEAVREQDVGGKLVMRAADLLLRGSREKGAPDESGFQGERRLQRPSRDGKRPPFFLTAAAAITAGLACPQVLSGRTPHSLSQYSS